MERRVPVYGTDHIATMAEWRIMSEPAVAYRALDCVEDAELLSCSDVLRTVVCDLLEQFGPLDPSAQLHPTIDRLSLPAFKRRALTLIASRLVMSAFSCATDRENLGLNVSPFY